MPSSSICGRSNISHSSPNCEAIALARFANSVGVSTFGGSFTRSRAKFVACARALPRRIASSNPAPFPLPAASQIFVMSRSSPLSSVCWYFLNVYNPSNAPSTCACIPVSTSMGVPSRSNARAIVCAPVFCKWRAEIALALRSICAFIASKEPNPTTRTRFAASFSMVYTVVISPRLPLNAPSAQIWLMRPSNRVSTSFVISGSTTPLLFCAFFERAAPTTSASHTTFSNAFLDT